MYKYIYVFDDDHMIVKFWVLDKLIKFFLIVNVIKTNEFK